MSYSFLSRGTPGLPPLLQAEGGAGYGSQMKSRLRDYAEASAVGGAACAEASEVAGVPLHSLYLGVTQSGPRLR